jgi:hypothetical protein
MPPEWSKTVNIDISGKLVPIKVEKSAEKFDCGNYLQELGRDMVTKIL